MDIIDTGKVVVQQVAFGHRPAGIRVDMLRLDLVHPDVSGNKWFKLKYNIQQALDGKYNRLLTFGGGWSNHLAATAAACKMVGLKSAAIVRGKYDEDRLTPTLSYCQEQGMEMIFTSRELYDMLDDVDRLRELAGDLTTSYIVPEGGNNEAGIAGAQEIAAFIDGSYTHACVSVGSGTTFTGLRNALPASQQLLGFAPMKGGTYLKKAIAQKVSDDQNWHLFDRWHFGGFGRHNEALVTFMNDFYKKNSIPLDVVYTSKMMKGISDLLATDYFPADAKILCIHTGGLQGNRSIANKLIFVD